MFQFASRSILITARSIGIRLLSDRSALEVCHRIHAGPLAIPVILAACGWKMILRSYSALIDFRFDGPSAVC